ncbi:MAG: glycosyltransferase family 2 protein [Sterolibacterium sp.]|nr:glycosyltransferase family 2 protein [Sterolibacterium sp.]
MSHSGVGVSIVAYQPDAAALNRLLEAVIHEAAPVVLLDNGGAAAVISPGLRERIVILDPGRNLGVAAGHNQALIALFKQGAAYALLFDQDSLPQPGMIHRLLGAEQALLAAGYRVAAVGPAHYATDGEKPAGFVRFSGCRPSVVLQADDEAPGDVCRCDFLITSGTLLRKDVFEQVGAFDEALFIDNVDIEWCYRAASRGLDCYGVPGARMQHALGDHTRRVPMVRRPLVVHSPQRIYFMTRNRWLLYWMPHIPINWKLADVPRMGFKLLAFTLFVPPRLRYLRAGLAGLWDALRRKGGAARKIY